MTITLRPELERIIAQAMETGAYETPEDVVADALARFECERFEPEDSPAEIDAKIDRAMAQFERGEFYTPEESRADLERRKAAWLAERRR